MISLKERKLVLQWSQKGKTQQEIAELLGCNQASISRLIKKYKSKGTIKNLPRSGRPTKLTKKNLSLIKSANNNFNSVNTKQVAGLVKQEIGKTYSLRHIERIMHKLGFSLITPRPQHIRHDQEKVDAFRDEFKKNFNRNIWAMK